MAIRTTINKYRLAAIIILLAANLSAARDSAGSSAPRLYPPTADVPDLPDIIRPPLTPDNQANLYREQFQLFMELLANQEYSEAEISAKNMVTLLLENAEGVDTGLPQALINLAAVQQLSGDLDSAILNFQTSIQHLEQRGDLLDQGLVAPLRGLASAQTANNNPAAGLRTLDRALHISNVNVGPHSSEQIPILDAMLQTHLMHDDRQHVKLMLERIETLARRGYPPGSEELLPTLFYKARIEEQIGMQFAERETYREIIRITSRERGKDHISLIDPYLKMAKTFIWDAESNYYRSLPTAPTAEWYFREAIAIAETNPDVDVLTKEHCLLSLADYYTIIGVEGKANTLYREAWTLLSSDDKYLDQRDADLSGSKALIQAHPHNYANFGYKSGIHESDPEDLLQGAITVGFTIGRDGTTKGVEVVEADPSGFKQMELRVRTATKNFIFRPRYADGQAVEAPDQRYRHEYFYRFSDLPPVVDADSGGRSLPDTAIIN